MALIFVTNNCKDKENFSLMTDNFKVVETSYNYYYPSQISMFDLPIYFAMQILKTSGYEIQDDEIMISTNSTFVKHDKMIKIPTNKEEMFKNLKSLSGQSHNVFTGLAFLTKKKSYTALETTKVFFDEISDNEINDYVEKFGDEAIKTRDLFNLFGYKSSFIQKIDGSFYNMHGVPLNRIKNILQIQFGYLV